MGQSDSRGALGTDLTTEFRWERCLPISVFVALGILVSLTILVVRVNSGFVAGILIGFLFVQILLAAIWTTLAPISLFQRAVTGTVFTLALCLCMYRCAYRDAGPGVGLPIIAAMIFQYLVYQLPLWYLRLKGWTLSGVQSEVESPNSELQFGIKHLLIWTTVIAVFMGVLRLLSPFLPIDNQNSMSIFLGLNLTLGNSLIALPIVWGCFSAKHFWVWTILAIAVCVLVSGVQVYYLIGTSADSEFFLTINIVEMVVAIAAMIALRFTGIRFQQPTP